jgi:hypothetical protein
MRDNGHMFAPTQHQVRAFFCDTYAKFKAGAPLSPMEKIAAGWIAEHPEYHAELADKARALETVYQVEEGRTNPFLHLSMHLTITEQVSIDQPRGIKQAVQLLSARRQSEHDAHHEVMECLGDMIWTSQRSGLPPDGHRYIDCVQRRASAD